ncbi:hypothetical protein HYALB_00000192 [Hymenoscyphus albidus]|uniref:C2H2-type domain-containing protein n=1 Tax=Hymenoscyphus albidus TaxID=595503 RepID=A0A9N9PY31_9HELO|nr:hypothetical protein HYALB_00000192 [Hymenoscyphus albidus]
MSSTPKQETTKSLPPLPSDYQFQSMDLDFELFPQTQELPSWSPIDAGQGENFFAPSFDFNVQQNIQPWSSSARSSQDRFTRSTSSSSMMDNCPLLSPSSGAGRTSYGSSLWTADTASTLNSVYNPSLQEFIEEEPAAREAQLIQPNVYNPEESTQFSYNSTRENLNHFSRYNIIPNSTSDRPPPVPQITYTCTICHRAFQRKDDWRRHEESHDPQKYWICLIGDPAVPMEGGRMCVFCNRFFSKAQREEMNIHLVKEHKINECAHKNPKWHRKDKLKQHLSQVHNLSEDALSLWEEWNRDVRKKWAWGCGYRGECSLTWKDRVNYIAEHYEKQGLVSHSWDEFLMVKGFMKQRYSNFNVDDAWRVLNPNRGDQFLKWSSNDARTLKNKLERHSEFPESIASEAKNMATNFVTNYETLAWASADSRVATLTNPIEYNDVQKACRELPSQKALPSCPVPMEFEPGATNFI